MKKEMCIIGIFLILVLITNVLAYESTITVKTGKPNTDITLKVGDEITGKTIPEGTFTKTSDDSGEVIFNYNLNSILIRLGFQAFSDSGTALTFLNNKQAIFFPINKTKDPYVILDKFVDIDLNKPEPTIEVYSGEEEEGIVEIAEEEVVKEEEINEEEIPAVEQEPQITGFAIGETIGNIFTSNKTYYIFGGILLLLVAVIFIRGKMNKKANPKITKLSEIKENKEKIEHTEDELEDAERKINEAKQELDEIRDKRKKLKEAQEKLRKDKEELKRLENNEEPIVKTPVAGLENNNLPLKSDNSVQTQQPKDNQEKPLY